MSHTRIQSIETNHLHIHLTKPPNLLTRTISLPTKSCTTGTPRISLISPIKTYLELLLLLLHNSKQSASLPSSSRPRSSSINKSCSYNRVSTRQYSILSTHYRHSAALIGEDFCGCPVVACYWSRVMDLEKKGISLNAGVGQSEANNVTG
jgi:hypothetical protein